MRLSGDDAFKKMKQDADLNKQFETLVSEIDQKALQYRVPNE
jgi:hypothetical protein